MSIEVTMPKLSDTMQEGTILKWRVKEGDRVSQGDIIAEVETDKAAMEMEAFVSGTVGALPVAEGETVAVGTVIAVLETDGAGKPRRQAPPAKDEEAPPRREEKPETEPGAKRGESVEAKPRPEEKEEARPEQKDEGRGELPASREVLAPSRAAVPSTDVFASPAARDLARQKGIDLSRVRGTGPGGRIVRGDVERALEAPAPREKAPPLRREPGKRERSVKIRRLVANKMVESWQNIPHFFVTVAVDMTEVIRSRKELGASINDFIIAAAARSLQEHPWVNSLWVDGEGVEQPQVNIAIAVATDRGLFNPVLHDCGRLPLKEISRQARELGEKAHAGRLTPQDMDGGTFTVSNMGMLGVESFSAIITPPQAAVLAVGTVKGEAVMDERGEPGVAPTVRLTLSADHRILDGADAAEFLGTLKSYLEAPVTLISGDYGKER